MHLRQLIVPLATAIVLIAVAIVTQTISRRSFERQILQQLTTILNADVEAMGIWLRGHESNAQLAASDPEFSVAVASLVNEASRPNSTPEQLQTSPAARVIRTHIDRFLSGYGYVSYFVIDRAPRFIAANPEAQVGRPVNLRALGYVGRMLAGETVITRPIPPDASTRTAVGRGDTAYIYVGTPVVDTDGNIVAALALGIDPTAEFSDILEVARFGESGETYAFDDTGIMISESRFHDDLVTIGLLSDGQSSVLNVDLRDPGGNMVTGFRPSSPIPSLPFTKMAGSTIAAARTGDTTTGSDIIGYNDYRGVPVIGAWKWLPEYEFGITTEVDVAEAYRAPNLIRKLLWGIFTLLVLTASAGVAITYRNRRLQLRVLEARQLGQYKLEKKIGEGGMGTVYRAKHALLRRPTAVKLLLPEKATPHAVKRFEREVRHTAKLTNPNTVAIFDYGRTPDGIFYYAMEYLPGVTITQLVEQEGGLPPARVLYILKQVCASLAEAHAHGLIHRDIKPSNIILGERGGYFDFVKVLDFGLVRDVHQRDTLQLTSVDSLTGTPLYVSPEAIENPTEVDPRTDLYALGAVAYYMLVGDHVFTGSTVLEVCGHHLNTPAPPPSNKMDTPLDPAFEAVILGCLAKKRADRPDDAGALLVVLEALESVEPWTQADGRAWWEANATKRDSKGAWHVDFTTSAATPASGTVRPTGDREVLVDLGARGTSSPTSSADSSTE